VDKGREEGENEQRFVCLSLSYSFIPLSFGYYLRYDSKNENENEIGRRKEESGSERSKYSFSNQRLFKI
jgi:hypothetical protein